MLWLVLEKNSHIFVFKHLVHQFESLSPDLNLEKIIFQNKLNLFSISYFCRQGKKIDSNLEQTIYTILKVFTNMYIQNYKCKERFCDECLLCP